MDLFFKKSIPTILLSKNLFSKQQVDEFQLKLRF
jgi:hypothetical protein